MVPMLLVFCILTLKNLLDANTFKTNQRYFSNTGSSLGLKTSTDNWKFMLVEVITHSDYKVADGE
jgi:hypothetical protein